MRCGRSLPSISSIRGRNDGPTAGRDCHRRNVIASTFDPQVRSNFGDILPYFRVSLWHDAVLTDLGTLGGRRSWANDVNGSQVVVGAADDPANEPHPFTWQNGVMSSIRVNFPTGAGWQFDAPL